MPEKKNTATREKEWVSAFSIFSREKNNYDTFGLGLLETVFVVCPCVFKSLNQHSLLITCCIAARYSLHFLVPKEECPLELIVWVSLVAPFDIGSVN